MNIRVKFYGGLHTRYPQLPLGQALACAVAEGMTVARLLHEVLALPPGAVGVLLVNGKVAEMTQTLAPEDQVALFPPIAGGG
ncbi:MAG: MoaD/ThiS family protein [Caldilineales bacterium]|nr:MoaD/ThiS family protein [Caldilineales bacterium]